MIKPKVITSKEYKQLTTPKKNKYGAKKTIIDGIKFDSIAESNRYVILKRIEQRGELTDLKLQVKFDLKVGGMLICKYVSDFTYNRDGKYIVEDVKGVITPVFKLKMKLMKAIYNIEILITK